MPCVGSKTKKSFAKVEQVVGLAANNFLQLESRPQT
jgi:hypothetical protein